MTLYLVIKKDGYTGKFHTLTCPARKPLIDVVRPMFYSKLSKSSVTHAVQVYIKLDMTRAASDIIWSSPAYRFEGQEWKILYSTLRIPVQKSQTCPRIRDPQMFGAQQRNAITCIIEEGLFFEYTNVSAASTAETGSDANAVLVTSRRSSLSSDRSSEIYYENPQACAMEARPAVNVDHEPWTITLRDALPSAQHTEPFKLAGLPHFGDDADSTT